mgnify:CR=1 FL=1
MIVIIIFILIFVFLLTILLTIAMEQEFRTPEERLKVYQWLLTDALSPRPTVKLSSGLCIALKNAISECLYEEYGSYWEWYKTPLKFPEFGSLYKYSLRNHIEFIWEEDLYYSDRWMWRISVLTKCINLIKNPNEQNNISRIIPTQTS